MIWPWILFLRILDAQESREAVAAAIQCRDFTPALRSPSRWQDWAAPFSEAPDHPRTTDGASASFARRLPARGTPQAASDLSWTLDIEARRDQARAALTQLAAA